jgi:hypothetical protein
MNSINAYTTQQIADEICKWVSAREATGGFDNFTSLSIYNNSDGLAFDIRAFDVVFCPEEE